MNTEVQRISIAAASFPLERSRGIDTGASQYRRARERVHRTERTLAEAHPGIFPSQKKFTEASIFLDTEFHENYTFVSCNFSCCSIDVLSIGRIGKWQRRKQPRR
jgi:hypothetical protein